MTVYREVGIYLDGPFVGRRKVHPYRSFIVRLSSIGVAIPEKLVAESDFAYVARISALYGGMMDDILSDASLLPD